MRSDDAGSLVFDTPELTDATEIVGFPRVHIRVSADAPVAHWIARVEDVQPNGTVALVAAALRNASRHPDPLRPEPLVPGQAVDLSFDLHFTTWTFKPGHRIRLAVTNAQFPMIWPTPYAMTTTLHLGEGSWVELPTIPFEKRPVPAFVPPEPRDPRPDAKWLECEEWPEGVRELRRDMAQGKTSYEWKAVCGWEIGERRYHNTQRNFYEASDSRPAESRFRGDESHRIVTERPGPQPGAADGPRGALRREELLRDLHEAPAGERGPRAREAVGRDHPPAAPVARRGDQPDPRELTFFSSRAHGNEAPKIR